MSCIVCKCDNCQGSQNSDKCWYVYNGVDVPDKNACLCCNREE